MPPHHSSRAASLVAVSAGLALALAVVSTACTTPRLRLSPCNLPGLAEPARCGTLKVFENRAAGQGRRIRLRVAVLPALESPALPDPFVYIAGGPGDGSIAAAGHLATTYRDLRRRRDFLLVDLRGTGGSAALKCEEGATRRSVQAFLDNFLSTEMVRACRQHLETRADLTQYTTEAAVDDLDDVRAALGYEKLNLLGASYGSRAALVYLRRHPGRARTAVLWGVVPTGARMPLDTARDAQEALDGTFAECAAEPACRQAFPDLPGDLARALARLEHGAVTVPLPDPAAGGRSELRLTRNGFAQALRYMLYEPMTALLVPLVVHAAAGGDFGPVAETAQVFARSLGSVADGCYLSVTCAEDVAFIDPAEVPAAVRGSFLGDFRVRRQLALCADWPAARLPKSFLEPVESAVPTLLLSGERDPATPARAGEQAARTLSASRHLVMPDGAHSLDGLRNAACVDRLVSAFIEAGKVSGLDTSCLATLARPPFELRRGTALTLSAAEEKRLLGRYAAAGGLTAEVVRIGGILQLRLGSQPGIEMRATTSTRFTFAGLPPTFHANFEEKDGAITVLVVDDGSGTVHRLERQP